MKTNIIGESVIAKCGEYAERVMSGLSYQEARAFCEKHSWKMVLSGRECSLEIVRDDEALKAFPQWWRNIGI